MSWQVRSLCRVGVAALLAAGAAAPAAAQMAIWYERDGSAYLQNFGARTVTLDGYTISSEANDLINGDYDGVKGWKALEDIATQFPAEVPDLMAALGAGALAFGSAPPGGVPGNLSELSLSGGAVLGPGERWFIGKPFSDVPIADNGYARPGYVAVFKAVDVTDVGSLGIIGEPAPEPSTLVLAALGALTLAAAARRRVSSPRRRPR